MHARRLVCFLFGLWLAGGLFMAWVATQNFREVDRLLSRDNPEATLRVKPFGPQARMLMRYQASEMNRWLFESWEYIQLAFGTIFFLVILLGSRENKLVLGGVLLTLLLVLVQRVLLTPELIAIGRLIDFVPDAASPDRQKFWVVHTAYSGVEVAKWLLLLLLTGKMVFSTEHSARSRYSRRELDRIDKPNYRSVNW